MHSHTHHFLPQSLRFTDGGFALGPSHRHRPLILLRPPLGCHSVLQSMAGGGSRKKLKPLADAISKSTVIARKAKKLKLELYSWSDLPPELLELIFSHLTLRANVYASAVCKSWHSSATSIRVVDQSPWLMYFPKHGCLFEFYNPSKREVYTLELPELQASRICYAKDNWLLVYKPRIQSIFFFNPFTQEQIMLPRIELTYQMVAFSCAPTSPDCVLFTLKQIRPTAVAISTCRPGSTEWSTVTYGNRLPFISSIWNKLVFSNGVFYCHSFTGWLGVFDPKKHTWTVLAVPPPQYSNSVISRNSWKGKFVLEHDGDILVIFTSNNQNPMVFKLNQQNMAWEEVRSLEGMTLFASFLTSYSRTNLSGIMNNSIYFPKVRFYGRRCVSYSLSNKRYYPRKQCYDWGDQDPFESIWIEPPEDLTRFFAES